MLTGQATANWEFRITDTADTTLITGGAWGIARYGNILYGNADSTHVNLGVACTTGSSGQNNKYCAVGGGYGNTASGKYATVGGGERNIASGLEAAVGGGYLNTASGQWATVGGGVADTASGYGATVAGGCYNIASGHCASIGGGVGNNASGEASFVAGDEVNVTSDASNTFAFGKNFTTSTAHSVIFYNGDIEIKVGIQTTSPTARLDVYGSTGYNQVRMRTSYTPTGTNDPNGNVGDIAWDDDYFYVKTSAGWKRTALTAF